VREFEPIIAELWDGFREINEIKTRNAIFAGLGEHLARAFGDVLLFIAEATRADGRPTSFSMLAWCCPKGKRRDYPHVASAPAWGKDFRSKILEKTLDPPTPAVFFGPNKFKAEERGPLRSALPNLAATRIWFYGQNTLCIGISKLVPSQDPDIWVGADAQVLRCFPELLATPLRLENEYLETELFRKTCRAGIPAEVVRRGEQILRPRVELAWRVRVLWALKTRSKELPQISGDYDFLFAQYLDARRYVALDPLEAARPASGAEVEKFARIFNPSGRPGNRQLVLHASGETGTGEDSFVLTRTALLSRHAVARALFWLAYKTGALSGGDTAKPRCSLAGDVHAGCKGKWQCLDVTREFVEAKAPPLGNVLGPHSVHASWLRCLWLEIYYRARQIREHRGEKSEELLTKLAPLYTKAVKATRTAFPSALAGLHEAEGKVRIDWRWLYIWMLGNAMLSKALAKEYGTYKQGQHGFRAHLDYYRDASTAVLFGLHLLRFWDSPNVPELWDLPEIRPDEVTQARLRLLCEYAYLEIGVDRTWQLEHHIGAQFQPEMILQASSPAHREHAFHVMDVCLLGQLLLQSRSAKGGPSRLAKATLGIKDKGGLAAVLRRWYPAALLHDVGYALALARRLPDLLNQFSTPDLSLYAAAVNKGVQDAHREFDNRVHEQFQAAGLVLAEPPEGASRDHGVVSANHLIHSLTKAAGDERLLKMSQTKEVLQAIARHNRGEEMFSAAEDPLSFFLILCDHLQDWDRTRVRSRRLAMSFLASTQMSVPFSVKGQGAAQYLVPNATYAPQANGLVFRAGAPRLELHYSVPQSALLEPACIWVDTCADFERIWFSPRFRDMFLVFVHPRSDVLIRSGYEALEMELLRDFARTPEGAFLTAWLKAMDEGHGDELTYETDRVAKTERFGLRLGSRRKATLRLLSGASGGFYPQFVDWKERQLREGPDEE
jgi:hypothetical protein